MMGRDFNMKFKVGDKIKMKEMCTGSGDTIEKGEILTVRKNIDGLFVGKYPYYCECQEKWQLIKKKVCKHKYQILAVIDESFEGDNGTKYKYDFIAVCTKPNCLEKKYI